MTRAMRHAAADLLAFFMADYYVYTATSGFGRLGAWLSFGWHHHYGVTGPRRWCGVDYEDYEDLRMYASSRI